MYGKKKKLSFEQYEQRAYISEKEKIIRKAATKSGKKMAKKELLGEQEAIDKKKKRARERKDAVVKGVQKALKSKIKAPQFSLSPMASTPKKTKSKLARMLGY
jgi:hypothetical protein